MDHNKAPNGPPPGYPPQAHQDAGSYQGGGDPRGNAGYYGPPAPQQQPYGPPGPYYQGGPPQGPYQQQPMYYQQQPPVGYQDNRQDGSGTKGGICAGILGALACCCCLDCFF